MARKHNRKHKSKRIKKRKCFASTRLINYLTRDYWNVTKAATKIKKAKQQLKTKKKIAYKAIKLFSKAEAMLEAAKSEFQKVKDESNGIITKIQGYDIDLDPKLNGAIIVRISYIF